ncbi:LCP family protein [Streptomyces sp. TRM66268-LWL]|uniref:LCP family protein n=1 Tax=Streptomyces polyasparticus TaxID=2767826 RepID=A0ABR7SY95_9ACTN|nr:LCP family protein [Streptomyces polyasparticus]MBC9719650.1 LCP family protein [Streptomyces polyasparticus]
MSTSPPQRRRRPRGRRILLGALVLLMLGIGMIGGAGWWAVSHFTGNVQRIPDAFPTNVPPAAQPAEGKGGENFLFVGLDTRTDLPTTGSKATGPIWKPGAQRSDTMMLVHLPEDRSGAYFVSLPRDSWVKIPGYGQAKLNAAFSWGGPPLLIDTVQRLTKVKIDHLAMLDWNGFKELTDAVGGVDIPVAEGGARHMSGQEALDYVRERKNLPRGDLDRTLRQQNYLRSVLSKVLASASLTDPFKTKDLLDKITQSVSVDDHLSDSDLRELAWDMKSVGIGDLTFMNAPITGTGMVQGQSVVRLDVKAGAALWSAVRDDTMSEYVRTHTIDSLGDRTR